MNEVKMGCGNGRQRKRELTVFVIPLRGKEDMQRHKEEDSRKKKYSAVLVMLYDVQVIGGERKKAVS